jgi:hypothetical protein
MPSGSPFVRVTMQVRSDAASAPATPDLVKSISPRPEAHQLEVLMIFNILFWLGNI